MQLAPLVSAAATVLLASGVAAAQSRAPAPADPGVADANPSELIGLSSAGEFNLRAELGAGLMLSSYQRDTLGYGGLGQTTARVGLNMTRMLSAQASLGAVYLPSDQGSGQMFFVAQGARLELPADKLGRFFADANFGLAESVRRPRVGLDAGAGFEFPIIAYFDAGPFARYHQVFAADSRLSLGCSLLFDRRRREPPTARRRTARSATSRAIAMATACSIATTSVRIVRVSPIPDMRRPGCPAQDRDRDGLQDPVDACPGEPPGAYADPERPGCPAPDRDGDGIVDPKDACPSARGVPSSDPARHGCPPLVEVESDRLKTLEPVFFATNEDRILPASEALLRDIAEALRKDPEVRLSIEGHTDDTGTDALNLELSQRRAESVKRELVRLGIAEQRLEARGFGRSRPLAPATTAEAREKNRRVEFRIVRSPGKAP